jgi:hypothetical protein
MTSMIWREPAHQTAERFNALHRPVYCYNFGRVSPGARTSRDLARHTAEIRYVFGNLTADGQYNEADQKVAYAMQWAWTTFARTGVPRSDGNGWPAFEAGAPEYMLIKDELSPRPYAVDELMTVISSMRGFWENLGSSKRRLEALRPDHRYLAVRARRLRVERASQDTRVPARAFVPSVPPQARRTSRRLTSTTTGLAD